MTTTTQHIAYFSATNNTRSLIRHIADKTGLVTSNEYNITKNITGVESQEKHLSETDLFIIGVPSFQGRVPEIAVPEINKFKGKNTPAIIVCTYGNRDYDDTLLELNDLLANNGFVVVSAGAFVAKHSIFSEVAANRPTKLDRNDADVFVERSMSLLKNGVGRDKAISIQGNFPYRKTGEIPLCPQGDKSCDKCGVCVNLCPTNAIAADSPRKTDKKKCISCARCIAVCPQEARAFGGLLYKIAGMRFVKKNREKRPNVTFYEYPH